MESFVITKDGMELQTKLVAGMTTAVFTRILVSEHRYTKDELYSLAELIDVRQAVRVSSITRKDSTHVEVIAAIENTGLDKGYYIQALGLCAEDGEGNEVLYAVSISGDHSDYMPSCTDDGLSEITYRMNIIVGSSSQVTVHVSPGAIPTVEQVEDIREDVDNLIEHAACNLLYIAEYSLGIADGWMKFHDGNFTCSHSNGATITLWSGEISLPDGGYAYPAASDSADVIVAYTLNGEECQVEISGGAVLPEGAAVTEYRLERKDGESRIVADIWPMISPGKRPVTEYVPYTGDKGKINECVSELAAPKYETPETRQPLSPGERIRTALGKIRRYLIDLKDVAFSGSYNDLEDKPGAEDIGAAPVADKSGQDFNDITAPGVYSVRNIKATNAPTALPNWSLIVTNDSIGGVSQIAVYGSYGRDAFIRSRNSEGDWGSWNKTLMEYNVANNLVTTNAGYVLDARQGKSLKDEINGINAGLSKTIKVRYIFKDSHLSAGSTYTGYYVQSPIGASEIVVFSINGNILWFGYTLRNSGGYGMFRKIFGEAEVTIPANGPDGLTHFYLDKDCNRMAVINI